MQTESDESVESSDLEHSDSKLIEAAEPADEPAVTTLAAAKLGGARAAVLASLAKPSELAGSPATHLDRAAAGREYLEEFGERGAVFFAEGRTLAEARLCFASELKAENERLRKQLEHLSDKLDRGEVTPAGFSGAKSANSDELTKLAGKTSGEGIAKFAASIKLPGQATEQDR